MRWNDLIGLQVGQYTIIEELGRGGAARVFRAQDEANARPVALKVLPIETDDRMSFMQRFAREAEVIRTLDHPNIVQVYDAGETEEFVFLVLRLIEGGTLRQRIASQRMSTQEVCQYMIQIALALHHAHLQGIIHRDVKPSNMLLDASQPGHILLTDFGTAKILNARGLTKTGATVGTPEYMSPEQAEGREVDQRSDIYSLGCALYEALAGRPPFVGGTSVSVLYQQVHAQPTYIRSYNAEAPRELWNVLHTCLAKRPDERYGTAARLAEELQPFAEGLIQPTPAPWHASVTGRPATDGLTDPGARPLRGATSTPLTTLPPPYTPAPAPVTPGMNGLNGLNGLNGHAAGPIPLYLEGAPAPTQRATLGPRGPRPTLRLPTTSERSGRLTGGPISPEGRQAISAFEAQLEAEERRLPITQHVQRPTQRPAQRARPTVPFADIYPTAPTPVAPQRAPTSGPYRGPTSGPVVGAPQWREQTGAPLYRGPTSGSIGAPQRAPTSGPRRATTTVPVDLGRLRADINPATLGRRRRQRRAPLLVGALLLALLAVGVTLGVGGLKLFAKQGAQPQATPRPTMTMPPATATATTAQPTTTATPTAQQTLDRQAARAFRAITIAPFSDTACSSGSMTTHFTGGPVYINLCMANAGAPGPVTVVVRQNGATIRTLISNLYPSAGVYYTQGHTLDAGSYDMLVTMQINGKQAVARDIAFTVQ